MDEISLIDNVVEDEEFSFDNEKDEEDDEVDSLSNKVEDDKGFS